MKKKVVIGQESTEYIFTTGDVVDMKLSAEQKKAFIGLIKIGVYKRLKDKGLLTEGQFKELKRRNT